MNNLPWKIFGLAVSLFLIIGGLTGQMVLRWTDNSGALVAIGFVFMAGDVYALATHKKQAARAREEKDEKARKGEAFAEVFTTGNSPLEYPYDVNIYLNVERPFKKESHKIYLNGELAGDVSNTRRKITVPTERVKNALCAVNAADGAKVYTFFEVTGEQERYREFVLCGSAFIHTNLKKSGIRMVEPDGAASGAGGGNEVLTPAE